jgi:hypothetical protein
MPLVLPPDCQQSEEFALKAHSPPQSHFTMPAAHEAGPAPSLATACVHARQGADAGANEARTVLADEACTLVGEKPCIVLIEDCVAVVTEHRRTRLADDTRSIGGHYAGTVLPDETVARGPRFVHLARSLRCRPRRPQCRHRPAR